MKYKEALELIGGFSRPQKMPAYGTSTPAQNCITGSKLRKVKNSTCSFCYALTGRYLFQNVQTAMIRRLKALSNPLWEDAFVIALTAAYKNIRKTYIYKGKEVKEDRFRWQDSGDLQSLDHLRKINNIALRCPDIRFWLPTRELSILRQWDGPFAPNLTVRVSAPLIGAKLNKVIHDLPQSTVGRMNDPDVFPCSAPRQNGFCHNCDACWTKSVAVVDYHQH